MMERLLDVEPNGGMPQEMVRAVIAVALLRTLRAVRGSREAGRPMPRHQALRLYCRHRSEIDPSAERLQNDIGERYLLDYYAATSPGPDTPHSRMASRL